MGRLDGKTAVITGGTSGIGLATAQRFVAEGAQVFITGRRQKELEEAAATIGAGVTPLQGDIASMADLERVFAAVRAASGTVDILFANAGTGAGGPVQTLSEESFDQVFDVNVKGTLFTVQKALPLMQAGGSIILTGSTTGSMGAPAYSVYSASKAAIRSFARNWAVDLSALGIRVNVLSPGPTATPGLLRALSRTPSQDFAVAAIVAQIPLGRMGTPEETAAVALFLASDDSSFMTGGEIFVDGGMAQI